MKCKKCGIEKQETEFRKRSYNDKEYFLNECKKCENERYTLICKFCNKEYKSKHKQSVFCSRQCNSLSKRKGETIKCANCDKAIYRKPYRLNRAKHYYCSAKCQSTHRGTWYSGNLIYNFDPLKTHEQRYKNRKCQENVAFIKGVFERDKYKCQKCGKMHTKLVAHHLESFHSNIGLRYEILNGITLCENCHKNFHSKFGYKNNTKIQFQEYLTDNTEPSR